EFPSGVPCGPCSTSSLSVPPWSIPDLQLPLVLGVCRGPMRPEDTLCDGSQANPPELDQAEDLASLVSVNESSVLNTLLHRYRAQLPHTYAGPDLIVLQPQGPTAPSSGKVPRGRRDGLPAHIGSLAQRAYWALLSQRRDQSIVTLGRSGAGKTTCCEQILEHLVGLAGSVDGRVSVEKIRATFTVLRAFGSVSTGHSRGATRFAMVMSLDFNATGRVTAAQLQTMLLEKSRVARQPEGEVWVCMSSDVTACLFLLPVCSQPEDKQRAAAAFAQLQGAMETLGISESEQRAIWRVLVAIYHLGAAGACKVGRKQFMRFEWANHAAEALGCEYEELNTATFKHHLRQIIEQVTAGPSRRGPEDEETSSGLKMTGVECVEGMASGLYQEVFAAVVSLINRSFSSHHLSMASIMVVDSPGFQNPRHQGKDRAATFEELCHNYAHERLQLLFYQRTFVSTLERYREVHLPAREGAEDTRGLFWVLDEEVRVEGSSDAVVLGRLCASFEKKGAGAEGKGAAGGAESSLGIRTCQSTSKVCRARWGNLSAESSVPPPKAPLFPLLPAREELRGLFQARAKLSPVCRAIAGLEGTSQQAQQRSCAVRRTFASSFAAVKRKAPCSQIKLQMDALISVIRRSQLHFIHCLVPSPAVESRGGQGSPTPPQPGGDKPGAGGSPPLDIPALRVQLAGSYILEALRLHRAGYADHMGLTQFRRRFQALDPLLTKKLMSAPEGVDERKVCGRSYLQLLSFQVFLKAGVISRLEKQREKLVSHSMILFQAACKGFLSRQEFKKLKIHRLAACCIQRNMAVFLAVKDWPWWQLFGSLRPLLSATIGEEQLHAKEEELITLRQKLEKSEKSRNELRQNADLLESKIAALTTELADERFKGDMACQVLESERAERLRASREVQELKVTLTRCPCCPQLRQRFELEIERMKQLHQKDREDKEEELEDVRQSCQKRLHQLEMQLEQEYEEKQLVLHEKQDLEGLIGTLCDQIGHRDFDVEKRLRRDLRRTHALLSDVQLLLGTMEDSKTSVSKEELEKLEQSEAKCEDALKTQKALTADLESMHSELESMTRSKSLVDEQLYRLQFERADLLKRIDEDQDDLNDLMQKHKDLIAQVTASGRRGLAALGWSPSSWVCSQLQVAQMRIEYLEQSTVDRAIVSRQEAVICDLENKTEFQKVQIKRFEVLVIRLRDSLIKMGEELSQVATAESQQRENSQYYQRRLEELKADMEELVQREAEASRRCVELVSAVPSARPQVRDGLGEGALFPSSWETQGLVSGASGVDPKKGRSLRGMGGEVALPLAANSGGGSKVSQSHSLLLGGFQAPLQTYLTASHILLQRPSGLMPRAENGQLLNVSIAWSPNTLNTL
uniref:Myosin XVIIIB n=1 Tax=Sus scrofa TaxID=9823 RepID=A0A8W4FLF9_PIG